MAEEDQWEDQAYPPLIPPNHTPKKKGGGEMHRLQNSCKQPHEQNTQRSNTWAKFKNLVTMKKIIAANLPWVEKDSHLT
jgi:hypothetical protein